MSEPDDPSEPDAIWDLPIGAALDLHAFAPADVPSLVEEYLIQCQRQGVLEVRLVHGRGKGVQRAVVRRLLAGLPFVRSFRDAAPGSGGWGATEVSLAVGDRDHTGSS